MEWLFILPFIGIVTGLFLYLRTQGIGGAPYQSISQAEPTPKPQPQITPKAKTEQEAKDDWINAFKGEPTEGSHRIVRTWYGKMVMKDGSDWPSNRPQHWPCWECSCGVSGRVTIWNGDYEAAEKKAIEKATKHINDMNYVEWKNSSSIDGRAF